MFALQKFLKEAGYTRNNPDGDFGPGTSKVVAEFQLKNGLDITGEADHSTIKAINKTDIACSIAAGTPLPEKAAPAKAAPAKATPAKAPVSPAKAATQPKPAQPAPVQQSSGGISLEQLQQIANQQKKDKK